MDRSGRSSLYDEDEHDVGIEPAGSRDHGLDADVVLVRGLQGPRRTSPPPDGVARRGSPVPPQLRLPWLLEEGAEEAQVRQAR